MKEFTIREFVDSLTSKLDSIHGNKGLDGYSLVVCKEAVEDKYEVSKIKAIETKVGESIFSIDKGEGPLIDFFSSDLVKDEDVEDLGNGLWRIRFQDGINFYSTSRWYYGDTYMNVRRIVLPPRKKVEPGKERLYILRGDKCYKLPFLKYPSSIKDLMKWLKKKKKTSFDLSSVTLWNYNQSIREQKYKYESDWKEGKDPKLMVPDIWNFSYQPVRNIKTEADIIAYNEWINTEYKAFIKDELNPYVIKSGWSDRMKKDPSRVIPLTGLIEIRITQTDIDQFCNEYNNRYKVERK